jgi:hypothetical protein
MDASTLMWHLLCVTLKEAALMVDFKGQALMAGVREVQITAVATNMRGCAGLGKACEKWPEVGVRRIQIAAGISKDCHSDH